MIRPVNGFGGEGPTDEEQTRNALAKLWNALGLAVIAGHDELGFLGSLTSVSGVAHHADYEDYRKARKALMEAAGCMAKIATDLRTGPPPKAE